MADQHSIKKQIDQICNQFEELWNSEHTVNFDSFLDQIDAEHRETLLLDLIEVDIELRQKKGLLVSPQHYLQLGEKAVERASFLMQDHPHNATLPHSETVKDPKTGGSNQIGPYELIEKIGEGGMGTVWLAKQHRPIRRTVAVKVIKAGISSEQVINRFEAERQALALMDHQNIARVLDAGVTEDGRPFFAMEHVRGVPFTEYCDKNQLSLNKRLELFIPVCSAVQHAHQKGIIHRDLKPSNVLVAEIEGNPVPKVIDFGLAKALQHQAYLSDETVYTEFGQVVGTLEYMSPEQADINSLDIDTRTDVYALGVMLYELLTGSTPLNLRSLKDKLMLQILQIIKEQDPPRPSTRLIESSDSIAEVSQQRQIDSSKLEQILRGELDWIVMKALEKDRVRRYETAAAMADDLARYLNHEPVQARPPSASYRIRKFVAQNRAGVTAAGLVLATLIAGIAGTTSGMFRAFEAEQDARTQQHKAERETEAKEIALKNETRQRNFAESVANFVEQDFLVLTSVQGQVQSTLLMDFTVVDLSKDTTLSELLDRAAVKLDARTDLDPLIEARLRHMIGTSYFRNGSGVTGISFLSRAVEIRQRELGPEHLQTLRSMHNLVGAYQVAGQLDNALPLCEQTLELRTLMLGPTHPDTLNSMNVFGSTLHMAGRIRKALPVLEKTVELTTSHLGREHQTTLNSMNSLALVLKTAGHYDEALLLLNETFKLRTDTLGADHPNTLINMTNLGNVYRSLGQHDKAKSMLESTLELKTAILGAEHPSTLKCINSLATNYITLGQVDQAVSLLEKAQALATSANHFENPSSIKTISELAWAYHQSGQYSRAVPLAEKANEMFTAKFGPEHPLTLGSMHVLAMVYDSAGQVDKGMHLNELALAGRTKVLGPEHPETAASMGSLGSAFMSSGKYDEALPLAKKAFEIMTAKLGPEHPVTLTHMNNLGMSYYHTRQPEKALQILEQALKLSTDIRGPDHLGTLIMMLNRARACGAAGDIDQAITLHKTAMEKTTELLGSEHPITLGSMSNLANTYQEAGMVQKAAELLEKSLEMSTDILGPDHPSTLTNMYALAAAYMSRDMGMAKKAVPLFEKALQSRTVQFGPDHPFTLDCMNGLASSYLMTGQADQALKIHHQTLNTWIDSVGPDNPGALTTMNNLAAGYWKQGQLDRSIPLFERCVQIGEQVQGRDSLLTLFVIANLGVNYRDAGRYAEAIPLLEEAVEACKSFPQLRWTKVALQTTYRMAGRLDDFHRLVNESLEIDRKELQPGSIPLSSLLINTSRDLLLVGDFERAEGLLREGLKIRENDLPDRWTTFEARSMLGGALVGQKKFVEAQPLLESGYAGIKERESQIAPNERSRLIQAIDRLIEFSKATDDAEGLEKWQTERSMYAPKKAKE